MKNRNVIWIRPIGVMIILSLLAGNCKKENNDSNTVDKDGNIYHTVTLGTQIWMVENLRTTHFNDGTEIPKVTDNTEWGILTAPAYCTYKNTTNVDSIKTFGLLYNGYAIKTGKICPKGWHVPSDAEWTTLENYLITNGYNFDGSTTGSNCAKSLASVTNWTVYLGTGTVGNTDYSSNRNATGFTAQPGGYRVIDGFHSIGLYSGWWTSTDYVSNALYDRYLSYNSSNLFRASSTNVAGLYIRCLKD
jgi:uncharacterized protein (TIGR02145 family)